MSNELTLRAQSGKTVYAVVRRHSDYYAWDDVALAWEAWADGSLADYSISLTDRSGDLYQADFPPEIAAGTRVLVNYYAQSGVSEATTDLLLSSSDLTWDGSSVASGASVSLDSNALTTLAGVKRHLRITDSANDTLLTELINAVSKTIERYCGRRFKAREYRQRLSTRGGQWAPLRLDNYPLLFVNRVSYGAGNALSVVYSGAAIRASVQVYDVTAGTTGATPSGGVRLLSYDTSGTRTESDLPFSTYASTTTLVAAINAVSGWTATTVTNIPAADLTPYGGVNAKSQTVYLTYPDQDTELSIVDYGSGLVRWEQSYLHHWPQDNDARAGGGVGQSEMLIDYRAGYEAIPADLDQVARELVQLAYLTGQNNPGLKSETLGDWSYTLADSVDLSMKQQSMLLPYMELR